MLGKLLKYEIKATGRTFLPLYALLILTSVVFKIFDQFDLTYIKVIISVLLGSLFVALCVLTLLLLIQRFYKNLLGDEGYLMFTLPVKTASLIWSKLIGFVIWAFCSVICALVAILILSFNADTPAMFARFFSELSRVFSHIGFSEFLLGIQTLLTISVSLCGGILMIYASMAIGQHAGSRRALISLGAYFGLTISVQTVISLGVYILSKISPNFMHYIETINYGIQMNGIMFCILLLDTALGAVYFFIAHQILSKKLNLE